MDYSHRNICMLTVALALREEHKLLACVKIAVFPDKKPCNLIDDYGHFCL
jgi:hypothetical protein